MSETDFLYSNEQKVNVLVSKILLYSIAAFPVVYILYFLGVFSTKLYKYNVSFSISTVLFITPWILIKLGYNKRFLKYFIVSACVISMAVVYSFITAEDILLLWLYPISMSCLYFDKKVTKYSFILTVLGFFCAQYVVNLEGAYRGIEDPLRAYLVGALPKGIELIVLSLIYISLAKRTRNLLENLHEKSVEIDKYSKNLENMVAERTLELEKAYEDLKEVDKLKSQFFANVSHELRTPLTLTLAPLESMLQGEYGEFSKEQGRFLNIIHSNCLKLLRLINNLLDFSKIDEKKMMLQVSRFDLALLVDNIIASSIGLSQKRNIGITFKKPDKIYQVYLDMDKTEKIIINLLSNALKFTKPGGSISFELREEKDSIQLKISDTGIGIKEADIPYIFERFRQVEGSLSREYEGTGIGLSLVKEFVELMKGSIKVESEYGRGTTFLIDFKKGNEHFDRAMILSGSTELDDIKALAAKNSYLLDNTTVETAIVEDSHTVLEASAISDERETILLVDDNKDIIVFLKTLLQENYHIHTASNGLEALELVKKNKIDLVISDIMMPKMSGYELLKEIRSNKSTRNISIILLSAKSEISEKIEGLETGADDYVTKPFNSRELAARVKTQLKLRSIMTKLNESKAALENLLNNAGQGFLQFGRDMNVAKEYSAECIKIFGEEVAGKHFPELLYKDDPEQRDFYKMVAASVFDEKSDKLEVYATLLPQEILISGRYIELEHKLIGDAGSDDNLSIMVILTDVTNKRILENQMEKEKSNLKMVVKAVVQYNDLKDCLNDFYDFCKTGLYETFQKYSRLDEIIFEVFRNIHSYKGIFSQFEMNNAVKGLHVYEDKLLALKNKLENLTLAELKKEMESFRLEDCLAEDLGVIRNTLGSQYLDQEKVYVIEEAKLREIERKIKESIPDFQYNKLIKEIKKIRHRSIKEVIASYSDYMYKVSERLGKSIRGIEVKGDEVFLDFENYKEMFKSILHIFRNCLDHGIEQPDERIIFGKEELGNICCEVCAAEDRLHITISDDGKGIDFEEVKKKAIEKGIFTESQVDKMTEQEVVSVIFNDSFSTKSTVDDISGRGAGLSAVKHAIERLDGAVSVHSESGKGTRFKISIPYVNS